MNTEWTPLKDIFRAPKPGEESEDGVKVDRAIDDTGEEDDDTGEDDE